MSKPWRALDKSTLELTAEGKATVSGNGTVTDFEYYPYSRDLLLLNAGGYVVQDFHVLRLAKDYLVFRLTDGTYATYYPSDRYATTLTLGANKLSLRTGETHQLSVEPTPPGTIMPAITWESSNTAVATVSADGLVTAVKGGTCTITATANEGSGVKAECVIVVEKPHEYVDLGLPSGTLWATTNVGAESPEDYGDYFAWGEVEPRSTYNLSTYFDSVDGTFSNFKKYYINGGKTELDPEDDAAYMNWGEGWRMPSLEQLQELYNSNYTTTQWTTQNGKNGRLITSKQNGSSLFLPAAGYYDDSSLYRDGSEGDYWSRSLSTSYSINASYLEFRSGSIDWYSNHRYYGFSVRPVRVSPQN